MTYFSRKEPRRQNLSPETISGERSEKGVGREGRQNSPGFIPLMLAPDYSTTSVVKTTDSLTTSRLLIIKDALDYRRPHHVGWNVLKECSGKKKKKESVIIRTHRSPVNNYPAMKD